MGEASKEETLPPGFRFHPTDEELITHYLNRKASDPNFSARAIADVDLNKCEPWDLPGKAKLGEKDWYFFSRRDRKYPTGVRTNRATNTGYWKTTGKDKEIFRDPTNELVGMKKTLVFYKGRAPRGEKTNWVMHEYRRHSKTASKSGKDEWVVCRVFQKSSGGKKIHANQSRANPYNLGAPPKMPLAIHGHEFLHHYHHASGVGQTYADLAELTRTLRWSTGMSLSMQSQGTYAGSSTFSGLNLNLVAAPATSPAPDTVQNAPRMPASLPQLQLVPDTSAVGILPGLTDAGFGTMPDGGRFQQVDHCMDLDAYWAC